MNADCVHSPEAGAAVWKGEQMVRAGHTEDQEKAQEQKKKD